MRWALAFPFAVAFVIKDVRPKQEAKRPAAQAVSDKTIFVGYLSAPGNIKRRERVRQTCFPAYQAHGVHAKFFIGRPSTAPTHPKDHTQGVLATPPDIQMANEMMDESRKYQDIIVVPLHETYRDLGDKTVAMFTYGLEHTNASIIVKVDDDTCANLDEVITSAKSAQKGHEVYGGFDEFPGDWPGSVGPDGCVFPYMYGPVYFLTRKLAYAIFIDDRDRTILWAPYGTSSEDTNIGKFIGYLRYSHPTIVIEFVVNENIQDDDLETKKTITRFSSKPIAKMPQTEPIRNCKDDDSGKAAAWYITRFAPFKKSGKINNASNILVAISGAQNRDRGCSWPSKQRNIIDSLRKSGNNVDVYVLEFVGQKKMDGVPFHAGTLKGHAQFYRAADAIEVDSAIEKLCNCSTDHLLHHPYKNISKTNCYYGWPGKDDPRCPGISEFIVETRYGQAYPNALRQLWMESQVASFLRSTEAEKYDLVVYVGNDYYVPHPIEAKYVNSNSPILHKRKIFVSNYNPACGVTNGFYIGRRKLVATIMDRFRNEYFPTLDNYEMQLLHAFKLNNISYDYLPGFDSLNKFRHNGEIRTQSEVDDDAMACLSKVRKESRSGPHVNVDMNRRVVVDHRERSKFGQDKKWVACLGGRHMMGIETTDVAKIAIMGFRCDLINEYISDPYQFVSARVEDFPARDDQKAYAFGICIKCTPDDFDRLRDHFRSGTLIGEPVDFAEASNIPPSMPGIVFNQYQAEQFPLSRTFIIDHSWVPSGYNPEDEKYVPPSSTPIRVLSVHELSHHDPGVKQETCFNVSNRAINYDCQIRSQGPGADTPDPAWFKSLGLKDSSAVIERDVQTFKGRAHLFAELYRLYDIIVVYAKAAPKDKLNSAQRMVNAMHSGVPTLVQNIGAHELILKSTYAGSFVTEQDLNVLLDSIVADPSKLSTIRKQQLHICQSFSPTAIAKKYVEMFDSLPSPNATPTFFYWIFFSCVLLITVALFLLACQRLNKPRDSTQHEARMGGIFVASQHKPGQG